MVKGAEEGEDVVEGAREEDQDHGAKTQKLLFIIIIIKVLCYSFIL